MRSPAGHSRQSIYYSLNGTLATLEVVALEVARPRSSTVVVVVAEPVGSRQAPSGACRSLKKRRKWYDIVVVGPSSSRS